MRAQSRVIGGDCCVEQYCGQHCPTAAATRIAGAGPVRRRIRFTADSAKSRPLVPLIGASASRKIRYGQRQIGLGATTVRI
jgi:hypothetical protein